MKNLNCKGMLFGIIGVVVFTSATSLVAEPVGPGDWSTARMLAIEMNPWKFRVAEMANIKDRYDLLIIEKGHGKSVNGGGLASVLSNDEDAAEIRANRPETRTSTGLLSISK